MTELTLEDRERGSVMIMKSLKAQINSLKLMMNKDYLVFMNITLFNELIKNAISPQCSQFVIVALTRGRMVHANKLLWEFLIYKKEWIRARDENILKQKEQAAERLIKSTISILMLLRKPDQENTKRNMALSQVTKNTSLVKTVFQISKFLEPNPLLLQSLLHQLPL